MTSLISLPFNQLSHPEATCPVCLDPIDETEKTSQRLSYLDLAVQIKYTVHRQTPCHSWCFTKWAIQRIKEGHPILCVHCSEQVATLDRKDITSIFYSHSEEFFEIGNIFGAVGQWWGAQPKVLLTLQIGLSALAFLGSVFFAEYCVGE